jgi:hypothetical protein
MTLFFKAIINTYDFINLPSNYISLRTVGSINVRADDELAKFAAEVMSVDNCILKMNLSFVPDHDFINVRGASYRFLFCPTDTIEQGHKVGVDGQCFIKKCPFETSKCANDRTCLKGLSCLARYI